MKNTQHEKVVRLIVTSIAALVSFATVNAASAQTPQNATPPIFYQPYLPIPSQPMTQAPVVTTATGPTGPIFAEQATNLTTGIANIVGPIAALALAILNRTGLFKNKEAITEVAKTTLTVSNKIIEDKERIKTLAEVMYKLTPEEKKQVLDEAGINMERISKEILATESQLKRLKPVVVAKIGNSRADPDTDNDLPREDTVTLTR
jgi:hypothetical protein